MARHARLVWDTTSTRVRTCTTACTTTRTTTRTTASSVASPPAASQAKAKAIPDSTNQAGSWGKGELELWLEWWWLCWRVGEGAHERTSVVAAAVPIIQTSVAVVPCV